MSIGESFHGYTGFIFHFLVMYRKVWDLLIIFMFPRSLTEAIQYLLGAILCNIVGWLVAGAIQVYSLYHLDNFRWGKTRITVSNDMSDKDREVSST